MNVATKELTFGYTRSAPVIEGLDLMLAAGGMYGLSGRSGRGKSTLLYLLGLLATPDSGDIVFGERAVGRLADRDRSALRATTVGFVFQDALLNPARSVLDNVTEQALYGGVARDGLKGRAYELLESVGVEVPLQRRPGEISGGQAQRVALCRALITNPAVILADEPTGNLDPDTTDIVLGQLRAACNRGALCVIASHDRALLATCDETISL